jgi:putative hydrolase of the HAD superfamily
VKYKNILLDLDNTLYDTRASERLALMSFLDQYCPEADKENLFADYKAINRKLWSEMEKGEIKIDNLNEERFRRFFARIGINAEPAEASTRYLNLLSQYHLFYPSAHEIYDYLTDRYRVALVTNGLKAAQRLRIRNTFLDTQVSHLYIAEEIGCHKPDKEVVLYIMAKEKWNNKKDTIMIGDSLGSDIQCAVNAQIDSIWCNFTGEKAGDYSPDYTVYDLKEIMNIL